MLPAVQMSDVRIFTYGLMNDCLLQQWGHGKVDDINKSNKYTNHAYRLKKEPCLDDDHSLLSERNTLCEELKGYSRIVVVFLHYSVEQEAVGNDPESGGDKQHHVEVERLAEDDVYGTELEPDVYDALDEADDVLHHLNDGDGPGAPLETPAAEVGGHSAGDHVACRQFTCTCMQA